METPEIDELCPRCSRLDFNAFFDNSIQLYELGNLKLICRNSTCPMCRLVVEAIRVHWNMTPDDVSKLDSTVNCWVKTSFWAHCGTDSHWSGYYHRSFHFRPSLGTDWTPLARNWTRYGSPRFTLCDLDRVSEARADPFPASINVDRGQILHRRLITELVDIDLLRSWVSECQVNHNHPQANTYLNMELLGSGRFRLVDVVDSCLIEPDQQMKYIALSYVWGHAIQQRQKTASRTWWQSLFSAPEISDGSKKSLFLKRSRLPKAIKDTIELAKLIGARYLWVDLLCINQDDPNEKAALVKQMHHIYESACFTVVAAGGDNADAGLPGLSPGTRDAEPATRIKTLKGTFQLTLARPFLQDILSSTCWNTRAWTFQEDVLSCCCLFFTPTEVFFSCRHHSTSRALPSHGDYKGFHYGRFNEWRESYMLETRFTRTAYHAKSAWNDAWLRSPNPGLRCSATVICDSAESCPSLLYSDGSLEGGLWETIKPRKDVFNEYAGFVHEFTKRHLTNESDVVAAFMGILRKFCGCDEEANRLENHGLLETDLERVLLWLPVQVTELKRRRVMNDSGNSKFPSWAWAGWVGPVEYLVGNSTEVFQQNETSRIDLWEFWPGERVFSNDTLMDTHRGFPDTFQTKSGYLLLRKQFDFTRVGPHDIAGWLREDVPELAIDSLCLNPLSPTLTLWTLCAPVAELRSENVAFVARKYDTSTNIYVTALYGNDDTLLAYIRPDSERELKKGSNEYKLVVISKGNRVESIGTEEFVVMLVQRKGDYFERLGITTIETSKFPADSWAPRWISLQ